MWIRVSAKPNSTKGLAHAAIELDRRGIKYHVRRTPRFLNVNDPLERYSGKVFLFVECKTDSTETFVSVLIGNYVDVRKTDSFEGTDELTERGQEGWSTVYNYVLKELNRKDGSCGTD